MDKKEKLIFFGEGWYPTEYNPETGYCFTWNKDKSSFLINSDRITGLEFTVKSGLLRPISVTFTFLDGANKALSSEKHEIGDDECIIKITVPRGARRCMVENYTFVPAMMAHGSVDIRTLGIMFVRSIKVSCGNKKIELQLNETEKFSEAQKEITTKRGLVSVIFPVYGNFYTDRLLLAIASARAQKGVDIEIVVSEQGESPKLKDKLDPSIKYLFKKRDHKKGEGDFNPGETRNDAVTNASGEFIYTNDADAIFMNEHFLEKSREILNQNHDMVLHRPPMRKLPIENLEEFKKGAEKNGIQATIASLNLRNEFLATTDDKKRDVRVSIANSEGDLRVRTTSMEEFERYIADPSLKANDHVIWSESMHYGGNLMRREQFESIGGYCEQYVNWGCEDTDLQWKLKNTFNLQFFPKIEEFTVIHLDHEKRYVVAETVDRNEGIFTRRRQGGTYQAIKEDKERRRSRTTLSENSPSC